MDKTKSVAVISPYSNFNHVLSPISYPNLYSTKTKPHQNMYTNTIPCYESKSVVLKEKAFTLQLIQGVHQQTVKILSPILNIPLYIPDFATLLPV